jgi:hypothetical protein
VRAVLRVRRHRHEQIEAILALLVSVFTEPRLADAGSGRTHVAGVALEVLRERAPVKNVARAAHALAAVGGWAGDCARQRTLILRRCGGGWWRRRQYGKLSLLGGGGQSRRRREEGSRVARCKAKFWEIRNTPLLFRNIGLFALFPENRPFFYGGVASAFTILFFKEHLTAAFNVLF